MVAPLALLGLSAAGQIAGGVADTISGLFGHASATSASAAATAKAKSTADDFEKMFLENSLDRLTQEGGAEGPLGENGTGGGVYRSMLTKQYAGEIVKSGGVGISSQIYDQLLKLQAVAHAGSAGSAGGGA